MSTRSIVERIQGGDPEAEEQLAHDMRRRVFVVLMSRIGDAEAARELTQDVLMAVLESIRKGRIDDPDRLNAFVHGVARNLANNHIRGRASEPVLIELTEDAAWADAEEEAEMADRRRHLGAALARLEDVDRRILTLSVMEGCSAPEVSGRVGLSADAVRARKSRALKRIGDELRKAAVSQLAVVVPLSSKSRS